RSTASQSPEQADDEKQDRGADECDDHLADDRVADDRDAPVEDAGEETAEESAHYADQDITDDAEPMPEREVAGREAGDQADEDPDEDGVEVQVYDHIYETPFDYKNACLEVGTRVQGC